MDEKVLESRGQLTVDLKLFDNGATGRLIIDPAQAKKELGEEVASRLKLTKDGTKVLWPQPTDSSNDPQNWSTGRKRAQLCIITMATVIPGWVLSLNTNLIFALAKEYDVSPGAVNDLANNGSLIACGIGGIVAGMIVRKFGRLPVLFWSQLIALGTLIGCTLAPNFKVFSAMRILNGFFGPTPQISGLHVVNDMYPFHLQTRKLNIWAAGNLVALFISPFVSGFIVTKLDWRWVYGITTILAAVVLLIVAVFGEETIYDRKYDPVPEIEGYGLRRWAKTLFGVEGWRMSKYREDWSEICSLPFNMLWRPQMLLMVIIQACVFGFGLGILVTNAILLGGESRDFRFGDLALAGIYGTPMVALLLGETCGRYLNDWIADYSIRRRHGIFLAEARLWTYFLSIPIFIVGLVVLGISFERHPSLAGIVMGWGIAQFAIMLSTVAGIAYSNDCFPEQGGEVMALFGAAWCFGGVGISYAQETWVEKHGALQALGVEAAIVAGVAILLIPLLQIKGAFFRRRFPL